MQMRPLLEKLELERRLEILLHHVKEAIVVLRRAARVLDEQSPGLPQRSADLAADLGDSLAVRRRQVLGDIDHRKIHFRFLVWEKGKGKMENGKGI